uniref:Uncharacterized protein n=1 Tax=Tanacetum cinerariifolium TaxID=118510 RepID=A0A6L2JUV3_TANCI|nr:hypothetical protein [Tanacetum cinerariifolium]
MLSNGCNMSCFSSGGFQFSSSGFQFSSGVCGDFLGQLCYDGIHNRAEVSRSNSFDVLNLVENDGVLGTNGGIINLTINEANSNGSSFWNVNSSSLSTTLVIEKINNIKKLVIDGKVTLVDYEGKPLEKIVYSRDYDSDDEVASDDNEMVSFLAKKGGYGTQSFLKQ